MTVLQMTKEDMIDLAGQLNKDIKGKEKDLDKLKKALRKIMKKDEIAEAFGADFHLKATDYTATAVDKEAAIQSFIGVRTAQIDQAEDFTVNGASMVQLLTAAGFSVADLKKVFTEDGVADITTTTTQHFHTLTFVKNEEEK